DLAANPPAQRRAPVCTRAFSDGEAAIGGMRQAGTRAFRARNFCFHVGRLRTAHDAIGANRRVLIVIHPFGVAGYAHADGFSQPLLHASAIHIVLRVTRPGNIFVADEEILLLAAERARPYRPEAKAGGVQRTPENDDALDM